MTVEVITQEKPQLVEVVGFSHRNGLSEHFGPSESEKQLRSIYLINTRLWLDDLTNRYQTQITVGNVPQEEWNKLFEKYDNFWFMGIYKPSQKGQESAMRYIDQYQDYLPSIDPNKDVVSSPFAIPAYSPNSSIAKDWQEWDRMVEKLRQEGKKVFIDFVPNHTAIDHPWVESHPEYYVQGDKEKYENCPGEFLKMASVDGKMRYLAFGKDPNFGPWIDTLQLNYGNLELQEAMRRELENLIPHADGFRCDMAMLINSETFLRSWEWCLNEEDKKRVHENPFWQRTIEEIKSRVAKEGGRKVEFIAEAYWDEDELGKCFDFIYDKCLYDRMVESIKTGVVWEVKDRIKTLLEQSDRNKNRWVTFTENHDEERVISKLSEFSKATTTITALISNSMFLVNQGQEKGCRFRPPMQVARFRDEDIDPNIVKFYDDLSRIRRSKLFQEGEIKIIDSTNSDNNLIIFEVSNSVARIRAVVAVNLSKWTSFAQVDKNEEFFHVYNLTSSQESKDDEVSGQKLTLILNPGEVKIAYLSPKTELNIPENDSITSEINPRICF